MSVAGKDDAPGIAACARIFLICVVVPSSTISMSWLVPKPFRLSFRPSLDYLTDALALASALGVLLVSFSYDMSRYGNMALEFLFLPGLLLIYVPSLARLISAAPLRFERICLLCQVGMCFFLVQLMVSPLYISSHDAMLHWITADNILRTQHLFGVNSLLPVSPYYPGLEIVTNALSSIGGLSTFQAGTAVIAAARLV